MPSSSRKNPTLPLVVAALAVLVTVLPFAAPKLGGADADEGRPVRDVRTSDPAPRADDPLAALARREPGDPMALGQADAPVVMIAYSEFQCPFCGKFARDTEPELIKRYVKDGTLRIEWRDFPYLGPESRVAALGGRAAAEQDRFWQFHDAMYDDQLPPNSGNLDEDYLVGVARDAGLDVERFRDQLRRGDDLAKAVDKDFTEGQSIGVNGTPAFLVNGRPIMGAQPLAVFSKAIEQAAEAAR
ncbi:MAG: DsbA family protein [Nocardioides sp.]